MPLNVSSRIGKIVDLSPWKANDVSNILTYTPNKTHGSYLRKPLGLLGEIPRNTKRKLAHGVTMIYSDGRPRGDQGSCILLAQ